MVLTVEQVQQLMASPEGPRHERKRAVSDWDKLRATVCAFANDLGASGQPGHLLIGVDDKTGASTGLKADDELLRRIGNLRADGQLAPMPSLFHEAIELPHGHTVVVVTVHPSDAPPVRTSGRSWVRTGSQNSIATPEEERRLAERRVAGTRAFDLRACPGATLADLDLDSFRVNYLPRAVAADVLAQNRRSIEDQLASLRFLDPATRAPTHAGLLVFGKDPTFFIPGAWVQIIRFEGTDRTAPVIADKSLRGPLVELLPALEESLKLQIQSARVADGDFRTREQPDYPLVALRELTLNAIAHRAYDLGAAPVRISWFSDRIEIQNPGGLYGQVTAENWGSISDYRNQTLAEALKVLGYVERFGVGISRVQDALARNGNRPAEFAFAPGNLLAVVRRV